MSFEAPVYRRDQGLDGVPPAQATNPVFIAGSTEAGTQLFDFSYLT